MSVPFFFPHVVPNFEAAALVIRRRPLSIEIITAGPPPGREQDSFARTIKG
jgi:hypothetical protein